MAGNRTEEGAETEIAARKVYPDGRIELSAEEARQGQVVLDSRGRKTVFVGGLTAFVILAVVAAFLVA